jgi:hypothetical protein
MRYFRHQQILLILMATLLLVFCQKPRDSHEEPCVWRSQADAAVFVPLKLLELPHGAILQKFKPPTIRWNDGTPFIQATSNMEVAFSNTSFMAFRRCVCIPLRL